MTSRLPDFYHKTVAGRRDVLLSKGVLTEADLSRLSFSEGMPEGVADSMIENVVGSFSLPLGIACNFRINGRDLLVPMVTEEPSVVAAASHGALLMREGEGIISKAGEPHLIGQVQLMDVADPKVAETKILAESVSLMDKLNQSHPSLRSAGGGVREIEVHHLDTMRGAMLMLHLIVHPGDAMGANVVNSMAEEIAGDIERLSGGRACLRILSNHCPQRLVRAEHRLTKQSLGDSERSGADVSSGLLDAYALATADPYRAVTHNKGVMNGVDAVLIASGNDWRSAEAAAHAYAAIQGAYKPLVHWHEEGEALCAYLEMPLMLGTVGGAIEKHPQCRRWLDVMGVRSARELAEVVAAVGLAQNLAALKALVTEGIQAGHMALHERAKSVR